MKDKIDKPNPVISITKILEERKLKSVGFKGRKRCPSCKFDRTYVGVVCPVCVSAGIKQRK